MEILTSITEFFKNNLWAAGLAAVILVILIAFLVKKRIEAKRRKQRAIFSNGKYKYKSRLGKKNINKYIK